MKKLILILLLLISLIGCGAGSSPVKEIQKCKYNTYTVYYVDGSTFDLNTGLDAVLYAATINEIFYTEDPSIYTNSRKNFEKLMADVRKKLTNDKYYKWEIKDIGGVETLEVTTVDSYKKNFFLNASVGKDAEGKLRIHPKGISFDFMGELTSFKELAIK